jgi:hypothetical protein
MQMLVGIFIYYLGTFGMGDISAESAGLLLMLLGVLGLVGGVIVGRFRFTGGAFMLIAGILGFFILFVLWIIPGIIGGILTFKKPRMLRGVKVEGRGGYV